MKRADFLTELNCKAAENLRWPETSDNVLSDWLEAKIIHAPEKRGQVRDWSTREFQRAIEIVRLKSKGLKNLRNIKWQLWFEGCEDVSIDFVDWRDRRALGEKFHHLMSELFRPFHSSYPEVKNAGIEKFSARSVLRNWGDLDSSLVPVVQYTPAEYLACYRLIRTGNNAEAKQITNPLNQITAWYSKWFCINPFPVSNSVSPHASSVTAVLAGMLPRAGCRESAAEISIRLATADQFETTRRLMNFIIRLLRRFGLRKVANSLRDPSWRVIVFVMLLHLIFQAHKHGNPYLPNAKDLDLFEQKFM